MKSFGGSVSLCFRLGDVRVTQIPGQRVGPATHCPISRLRAPSDVVYHVFGDVDKLQ